MKPALSDDLELVGHLDGMHVGLLTTPESEALSRLVRAGLADREYSGIAGLLGLARVRLSEHAAAQLEAAPAK